MLKIAVCDDDAVFVNRVVDQLERWPDKPANTRISCFSGGDQLVRSHAADPFDVILLDMVMSLMDGIETAREIRNTDSLVKIIFLTASPEFALESYSVKAYNYLLKPVKADELYRTLDELMYEQQKKRHYILIHSADGTHRILLDEIECVEAQKKHTLIVLTSGQSILCNEPLHILEEKLLREDDFLSCHRSYLVNIQNLRVVSSTEIETHSGYRVPISRSNKNEFTRLYFDRMFQKEGER